MVRAADTCARNKNAMAAPEWREWVPISIGLNPREALPMALAEALSLALIPADLIRVIFPLL